MNKTALIIQREYLTRVRNKTFLITTILMPFLFAILIFGPAYLSMRDKEELRIAVLDQNGYFKKNLQDTKDITFSFPADVDTTNYTSKGYSAILIMPAMENNAASKNYVLRSKKTLSIGSRGTVEREINAAIENKLLQDAGIQKTQLDSIHARSQEATLNTIEEGSDNSTKESNQLLAYGIGMGSGFLIYITMLIYGMMVMRGVMEEKTSRIAEVIVSSVKPFQLMMGKIIGIGAVGITQFLIWIMLVIAIVFCARLIVSPETLQQVQTLQQNGGVMGANNADASKAAEAIYNVQHTVGIVNWGFIMSIFLFYFLGGYVFYAALFAAVGSVVDDAQNSQSLTVPITMPIIFSFIIVASAVNNPDSNLAFWGSLIPFSSPMVMMARVAYGVPGTVPYWQLFLSMLLLIGGFIFTTWLAGKIYRTGILLYGKKVTWGQMMKWAFRRA